MRCRNHDIHQLRHVVNTRAAVRDVRRHHLFIVVGVRLRLDRDRATPACTVLWLQHPRRGRLVMPAIYVQVQNAARYLTTIGKSYLEKRRTFTTARKKI